MAQIYANENIAAPVVAELRRLGHDVVTTLDAKKANQGIPDEEVLRHAATCGRAVLTHNHSDFIELHRDASIRHAGIISVKTDNNHEELATRIHKALADTPNVVGQFLRVTKQPVSLR